MAQPETRATSEQLPPISFEAAGDSAETKEANLESVKPSPGYPTCVRLVADAITKRADTVLLDYAANAVAVRYQVDGMWHNMPPIDRSTGDYMLATMKRMADLDYRQRRERQSGRFVAEYLREKHKCQLTSQGIASGERVVLEIARKKPPTETLQDVGMREGMRNQLIDILNSPGGIVLFSALPGDGLSTTWRAAMHSADRFMRDFITIEEESRQEPEVINVTSTTYNESKGENPVSVLRGVLLREPHAMAFAELPDAATLNEMSQLATVQEKTILGRLYAKHAVEAILRLMLLKPDMVPLVNALKAVVSQRVLRKLCENCKQAYQPNPKLIAQLGIPPSRVPVLYTHFQPRQEDLVDAKGNPVEIQPCDACGGPGYFERTGIFEMLVINDQIRAALRQPVTVQKLGGLAQKLGHVSLRDEGVVLVARGVTSLEELQRVLKK